MAGCTFYTIINTGVTTADFVFQSCTDPFGCVMTATTQPGVTYYINSFDPSLTQQGDVVVYSDILNNNLFYNFTGSCGDNFSFGFRDGVSTAFTLNEVYCIEVVKSCDPDIPIDLPQQCYHLVSQDAALYQQVDLVSFPLSTHLTTAECEPVCPCAVEPTPTPTITPTQTPTPSITPTPIICETYYCITNTGYDYDDSYNIAGIFNGKEYWTGETNGYYVYFNSGNTQWCLSTSLGGSCLLFGKSPCTSQCPDLCDEYFNNGVCPTPTPTPTVNCDVLDFEAIFNCDVPNTPTPTPTPSFTPTQTPTPTSTDTCGYFNVEVTVEAYTPTPTTTPTNTPTPSITIDRPFNFSGDVTFNTLDSEIQCPSSSKFQDCYNGEIYSTTNSLVVPGNITLEPYMIFQAIVDGESKCISYLDVDTQIIGINNIQLINGPLGYSNLGECIYCVPQLTQTPTLTPTPTPTIQSCQPYSLFTNPKDSTTYLYYDCCNGNVETTVIITDETPQTVCSSVYPIVISGPGIISSTVETCIC